MKKMTKALAAAVLAAMVLAGCGTKETNDLMVADVGAELGEYKNIPVTVDSPEVTDEDVDNELEILLYYYSMGAESDRTVIEDNDTVWVTLYLYDEAGAELDDGSDHEGFVYIGSGQTYPELEAGLIGKETGQEYEIPITLPDPYEFDETLSGQTITAKVTPQYIREPEALDLETLTDEQAEMFMEGAGTVQGLKDMVREMLTEETKDAVRRQAYSGICSYLLENCKVDPFPYGELEQRMAKSLEQTKELCETYYGITFEEYLAQLNTTEKAFTEDIKSTLSDTIRLEVIFTAIGDAEGIQYDEAAFNDYITQILAQYDYEKPEELYAEYGEDYIKRAYRIEYIVDWLIDQADLSYTVEETEQGTVEQGDAKGDAQKNGQAVQKNSTKSVSGNEAGESLQKSRTKDVTGNKAQN